jgi:hypothetical protein
MLTEASKEAREEVRSSEIRTFRRLLELERERKLKRSSLRTLPLRLHQGSSVSRGRVVYATPSTVIAEALGGQWPTWSPPLPFAELAPLLPLLDVEVVDESNFSAEIPGHLAAASFDAQDEFVAACGHFHDYLALHHPTLQRRLSPAQWAELRHAHVIVGSGWGIRVRAGRRRTALLSVRAHLFREPLRLCLSHEMEIDDPATGGETIAGFVVGDDEAPEERSPWPWPGPTPTGSGSRAATRSCSRPRRPKPRTHLRRRASRSSRGGEGGLASTVGLAPNRRPPRHSGSSSTWALYGWTA